MSLKDQIKLTKANLDEVAILLPTLFDEWGESWAEAYAERDRAKESLTVARAEADEEIRKNPKDFGLLADKPTEVWIASKVTLHPKVAKASEDVINAQYNLNMIVVGKETLEHTEKSLNILADLYRNSYFVARSRLDSDYTEKDVNKARDEQNEALQKEDVSERKRRRRA